MRIKELDALRGLAALAVVFYHYTTQYDKLFGHTVGLNWQLPYGSFGVQLFFMISGFVIFLTLDRITKPMDFVVSRASRLYPPYWSAIIMTTAIVWTFGLHGEERNLFTTLTNFTMIQGVFEIPDVDGVYWTLLYELIFYCIIFTFFKWGNFKKIHWLIIIGLLINILNSTVDWIPWKIQLFLLLQYNHLFSAGIIFYLIKKEEINKQYALSLLLCLIAHWMQGELISSILVTLFFDQIKNNSSAK
jgi:peptidoglycan/LPS O-acetylase OafA/YrhL